MALYIACAPDFTRIAIQQPILEAIMKSNIHPEYHPCVFVDSSTGAEFLTYSTMKSDTVRQIDGVDHMEIRLEITSDSHPFWTGTQKLVDTEGRIDRFRKKYGRK